jgi:acetoin utilization deacetylase AcuC-like enzyme
MTTLLVTDDSFDAHVTPDGHPERVDRLKTVRRVLEDPHFDDLQRKSPVPAEIDDILRAHPASYVNAIRSAAPDDDERIYLDPDTSMVEGSWDAALNAAGAAKIATDSVFGPDVDNAFCAIRPPGHHAEKDRAMGFCLFNTVAIAARYAQQVHGAERVAIIDFDVHHGNGTQDIFWDDPSVMFCSTHQMPLYPGSGALTETGAGNIVNAPLASGDGGRQFKQAVKSRFLPALRDFSPDFLLVSAGFDAHQRDPLAGLNFTAEDFDWVTGQITEIADEFADGRLVAVLEGGYDLQGLAESTVAHVNRLMGHNFTGAKP